MFGRNRKAARPTSHIHEFSNHNVGADLQRQVCRVCGHITINPIPPTDLRSEIHEAQTGLLGGSPLAVRLGEAMEPVLGQRQPGERRSRR